MATQSATKTKEKQVPAESTRRLAQELGRQLARHLKPGRDLHIRFIEGESNSDEVTIPEPAARHLTRILGLMAEGSGVVILGENAEVSTQQAAELLNVSRPYLIKLLELGEIPFRLVGNHRRVLAGDVLVYKQGVDQKRRAVLDELAAQGQELKMGY